MQTRRKHRSTRFRPEVLNLEAIFAASSLSVGQLLGDQLVGDRSIRESSPGSLAATPSSKLTPLSSASPRMRTVSAEVQQLPARRAAAGPVEAIKPSAAAAGNVLFYIPSGNAIAIAPAGPTGQPSDGGGQPVQTHGGAGGGGTAVQMDSNPAADASAVGTTGGATGGTVIPALDQPTGASQSSDARPVKVLSFLSRKASPEDRPQVSSEGEGIPTTSTASRTSGPDSETSGTPRGSSYATQGESTAALDSTQTTSGGYNYGGYGGTYGGYYGSPTTPQQTGSGYYTSTSSTPSSYSTMTPSSTYGGTSSGYYAPVANSPAPTSSGGTGSSYYGAQPVSNTPASSNVKLANNASVNAASSGGTFTLAYDDGAKPNGAVVKDDVGDGVRLTAENFSGKVSSIKWTVSGADSGIVYSTDAGAQEIPLTSPQTTTPLSNFQGTQAGYFGFNWSAQPGTKNISVQVNFSGGGTATSNLTVQVAAPKLIYFTRTYQSMAAATLKDNSSGMQGTPIVGLTQAKTDNFGKYNTVGNAFAAQVDGTNLAVGGQIFMLQTLTYDAHLQFRNTVTENGVTGNTYETTNTLAIKNAQGAVTGYQKTPSVPMLDQTIAYANTVAACPAGQKSAVYAESDSPALAFGGASVGGYNSTPQGDYAIEGDIAQSFTSTLMYKATFGAAVPIASIKWKITAQGNLKTNIKNPKGYYQLPSSWLVTNVSPSTSGVDQGAATTTYPTWTGNTLTTLQNLLQPLPPKPR